MMVILCILFSINCLFADNILIAQQGSDSQPPDIHGGGGGGSPSSPPGGAKYT